jgi:DNA-binding NarL/FixJ family response regulator
MKLILADSNELIRVGLRTIFNSHDAIEIIGEAKENKELLDLMKSFGADVVLIDYTSPGFEIDIVPKVLNQYPLVVALRSGVKSYVKKDCDISEIINAIKETEQGNKFFCGQILETIQRAQINVEDIDFESFSCEPVLISDRECEIIKLIAEGQTNAQIADLLFLSNHTINTHRKNIMAKLGVKNTAGIVMYAVKTQLVSPNKFLFAGDQ